MWMEGEDVMQEHGDEVREPLHSESGRLSRAGWGRGIKTHSLLLAGTSVTRDFNGS